MNLMVFGKASDVAGSTVTAGGEISKTCIVAYSAACLPLVSSDSISALSFTCGGASNGVIFCRTWYRTVAKVSAIVVMPAADVLGADIAGLTAYTGLDTVVRAEWKLRQVLVGVR